jgi:LysR family transcriptional regulator, benzoate and cis,cis-muconate-responsive activator of ben and cat genes
MLTRRALNVCAQPAQRHMEIKQLRFFLAVAETLNFTRAAERMGIAQPPLSQRILALERELGTALFIRTKRSVSLTQAGETLLIHARRLVNASEHTKEVMRAVRDGRGGVLNVGAIFSTLYTLLPNALRVLKIQAPDIVVNLREMTIANQLRALQEGQIDVGILRPPIEERRIKVEMLYEEQFIAAIPAEHPLAAQRTVTVQDFIDNPFVGINPGFSRNYSIVAAAAFADVRDQLRVVHETSDMHSLIAQVGAGIGLAIVPQSLTLVSIPEVVFRPISFAAPSIAVSLAWHEDSTTPTLLRFIEALRMSAQNIAFPVLQAVRAPLGRKHALPSGGGRS